MSKRTPSRRTARPSKKATSAIDLDARAFPALASFLKGYLHQDFPEEHGSVSGAAAAFRRDASADARRKLVAELETLTASATRLAPVAIGRFVTRDLGSAWNPGSAKDLVELLRALRDGD